ncbi:MAG TPA: APC family permease [Candidatus Dormibacteraeota bacterium]|nr:APC family permease [Candidatus Dormibacteraeota bacterium]
MNGEALGGAAVASRPRRRIKVRGGPLGWFLCWAVVFADIGTSIYYVPGILHGQFGTRSTLFVGMTLVVFILLAIKYAEVAWRYPEGGGVVNVASRALHPFAGLLGGCFIIVDYYLTVALSALSGVYYLAVVAPGIYPGVVPLTVLALVLLGTLNALGIKESARVSAVAAMLAGAGQLLLVAVTAAFLGPAGIARSFEAIGRGPALTPVMIAVGYGAAFLAFSGLETITQLAPAMREVRRRVASRAMLAVVATMAITSPLLTLWSTTLLTGSPDPNQFISLLGAHVSGAALGAYIAVTGALLLIFASNTAVIGAYHVFIALARMGFLPRALERRNRWRGTPHWAILLSVSVPLVLVVLSNGQADFLGDLYAFGLLGAFIVTNIALDVVRWHDGATRTSRRAAAMFWLGILTTVLVTAGWLVNLVAKPHATLFGGGITVLGLLVGLATYHYLRSRQPVVFPFQHRPERPVVPLAGGRRLPKCQVLAILPHDPETAEAVVTAATQAAAGDRPLVFLYRGDAPQQERHELLEVADPYLRDRRAQVAFSRAEQAARRRIPERHYVYVPGDFRPEAVGVVWKQLAPQETIMMDGDQDVLPPLAVDRVRRTYVDGFPVLRLVSRRRAAPATAAS